MEIPNFSMFSNIDIPTTPDYVFSTAGPTCFLAVVVDRFNDWLVLADIPKKCSFCCAFAHTVVHDHFFVLFLHQCCIFSPVISMQRISFIEISNQIVSYVLIVTHSISVTVDIYKCPGSP